MEGDNHDFRVKIMIFGSFWKSWFSTFAIWKRQVRHRIQTHNQSSEVGNLSTEPSAHFGDEQKDMYSRTPLYRSSRDLRIFTFISGSPLKRGKITLTRFNWDQKMLTFIDGSPLKAGPLSRGSTVFHSDTLGKFLYLWFCTTFPLQHCVESE